MQAKSILGACAAVVLLAAPALAQEVEKQPQQNKFATCAHESKGLRGDEHQKFMSECLKGQDGDAKKEAAHRTSAEGSQRHRMKECNEEAGKKSLHGDERRSFMSAHLKG